MKRDINTSVVKTTVVTITMDSKEVEGLVLLEVAPALGSTRPVRKVNFDWIGESGFLSQLVITVTDTETE